MSRVIVSANQLGKRYRVLHPVSEPKNHLDAVAQTMASEEFWALRNISFEISEGEVVGVLGPNGAGKTTLLKILSRVTRPTEGWARVDGRLCSLLQVGAGFHNDLSGRENVYFNGAMLGMSRSLINSRFDEIVAFAGVERFIDMPLKHYSSGMAARLAFSVAAHLEPDVLILDEALSVGDAAFQRKCQEKMKEVVRCGRTAIVVSHNLSILSGLCTRAMLIENGQLIFQGELEEVVSRYLLQGTSRAVFVGGEAVPEVISDRNQISVPLDSKGAWLEVHRYKDRPFVALLEAGVLDSKGEPRLAFFDDESFTVFVRYRLLEDYPRFRCVLLVYNGDGTAAVASYHTFPEAFVPVAAGEYKATCCFPEDLLWPRNYTLEIFLECRGSERLTLKRAFEIRIEPRSQRTESLPFYFVKPRMHWDIEGPEVGVK